MSITVSVLVLCTMQNMIISQCVPDEMWGTLIEICEI